MRSYLLKTMVVAFVMLLGASCLQAAELKKFNRVRYVPNESNDGDSFLVRMGNAEHRVRLYFVDCPETTVESKTDAVRVRKQKRYFGLKEASWVIKAGLEAKRFVERALSKPFTVHTAFASAGGRSARGRVYAFVTTSDGKDLARLLVANGYARAYGIGRKTPRGDSRDETADRLGDLEAAAAMKRAGIWKRSDPDRIVKMREEQRVEDKKLKVLQKEVEEARRRNRDTRKRKFSSGKSGHVTVDINKASEEELQSVKGIGPVLARRIIDGRPYKSVGDLLDVKGISKKKLEKMWPYLE